MADHAIYHQILRERQESFPSIPLSVLTAGTLTEFRLYSQGCRDVRVTDALLRVARSLQSLSEPLEDRT